ncbi:hypothetical protein NSPZN2_20003 [Nitrospira defluvii]|uniref:Uncharacterized protein n=1 Tax=Nitrospira defluvii TaxID=330214 RepID=A0ABM8RCZ0_9BACT|nr:hypothetical protein NSPZN2_20003 [Nitrospira defluvii]
MGDAIVVIECDRISDGGIQRGVGDEPALDVVAVDGDGTDLVVGVGDICCFLGFVQEASTEKRRVCVDGAEYLRDEVGIPIDLPGAVGVRRVGNEKGAVAFCLADAQDIVFAEKGIEVESANGQAGNAGPLLIDDAPVDADVGHRFRQVDETYAARATLSTTQTRVNTCIYAGLETWGVC